MPIYGDSYIVNIKDIIKDIMLSILRTYMGMPIFGNVKRMLISNAKQGLGELGP